jgi:hypothetical protein
MNLFEITVKILKNKIFETLPVGARSEARCNEQGDPFQTFGMSWSAGESKLLKRSALSGLCEQVAEHFSRTVTMPPTSCPSCGRVFMNSSSVLKHMNHRYSSCHLWFAKDPQQASPPMEHSPSTHAESLPSHCFPNAGHVFDSGPGFLGWFHSDKDADARSSNPFHPFLSKGEWEIARFLSCSALSMKLIDEFLSLSLVSSSAVFITLY